MTEKKEPTAEQMIKEIKGLTSRMDELKGQLFSVLYGGLPKLVTEDILEICRELDTQDPEMTSHPMFLVQRTEKVYGVESGYEDGYNWIKDGTELADDEEHERLDALWDGDDELGVEDWRKCSYKTRPEFITACFTRKNAEWFIERNKHHYGKMTIYVESAYRNPEWQNIRELFKELNDKSPQVTRIR